MKGRLLKMKIIYDKKLKEDFINNYLTKEHRKKRAEALFNIFAEYEEDKERSLLDFNEQEINDVFIQENRVSYECYSKDRKLINEFRVFCKRPQYNLLDENDIKKAVIDSGKSNYVFDPNELYNEFQKAIDVYGKKRDFDYSSYFLIAEVYGYLLYYGCSDEQATNIFAKNITNTFVLPNGVKIDNQLIKDKIMLLATATTYVRANNQKKGTVKSYNDQYYILKKMNVKTIKRMLNKLANIKLNSSNIIQAGEFFRVFAEDMNNSNTNFTISYKEIVSAKISHFTIVNEERYQLWKEQKINAMNAQNDQNNN